MLIIGTAPEIPEGVREYRVHGTRLGNRARSTKEKHAEPEEPLTLNERVRLREPSGGTEREMKCASPTRSAAYLAAEHR